MGPAAEIAQGTVAVLLTPAPPCHTRICQLASKQLSSWAAGGQEGRAAEDALAATLNGACIHLSSKESIAENFDTDAVAPGSTIPRNRRVTFKKVLYVTNWRKKLDDLEMSRLSGRVVGGFPRSSRLVASVSNRAQERPRSLSGPPCLSYSISKRMWAHKSAAAPWLPIIWLQKLPPNSLLWGLHTMSKDCSRDSRLQRKNKSFRNKVACFLNQITFTVYIHWTYCVDWDICIWWKFKSVAGRKSGIRLVLQNLTHMKEGLVFERFPELDAKSSFFSRPLPMRSAQGSG